MTIAPIMRVYILALFLTILSRKSLAANPVSKPILSGRRVIETRFFAQIPDYEGSPPQLIAIVNQGDDLYVSTSSSGGLIYKVTQNGTVSLFFDVASAINKRTGRNLNVFNPRHGGLRGIAFHPRFQFNGKFYVSAMEDRPEDPSLFTYFSDAERPIRADSVILEFRFIKSRGFVPDWTYREVMRIGMPVYDHPVKQIAFSGRYLLITHGDGSVQSAIAGGGLNNDALGKVLRIDPLRTADGRPYSVPPDNPFVGDPRFKDEIFAVGFRNPHNICVSKFSKNGIFVTDAGRDNVEEVNILKPGANYGWSEREGTFVHVNDQSGIITGIADLPEDDAQFNYTYPNIQVGHEGEIGDGFVGQALAGACPIENNSSLKGIFVYANFPTDGQVYYSFIGDANKAVVQGPPDTLTQAKTYRAMVNYDHDNDPNTPPLVLENLRAVLRSEGLNTFRSDIRFGRGGRGELYWTNKRNGKIYQITNSLPQ